MVWLLILVVYQAPADAVDWNGPWKFGMSQASKPTFQSEAECRNAAIEAIGRIHQGMLAPIRFRCVSVESGLPKNAPR
jgi:hypothetical protein